MKSLLVIFFAAAAALFLVNGCQGMPHPTKAQVEVFRPSTDQEAIETFLWNLAALEGTSPPPPDLKLEDLRSRSSDILRKTALMTFENLEPDELLRVEVRVPEPAPLPLEAPPPAGSGVAAEAELRITLTSPAETAGRRVTRLVPQIVEKAESGDWLAVLLMGAIGLPSIVALFFGGKRLRLRRRTVSPDGTVTNAPVPMTPT